MTLDEVQVGLDVIWRRELRGGYGYVEHVQAKVVKVTDKRVSIACTKLSGDQVVRSVKPESLRLKQG